MNISKTSKKLRDDVNIQRSEKNYQYQIKEKQNKIELYSTLYNLPFIQILPIVLTICMSSFYFGYTVVYLGNLNIEPIKAYYRIKLSSSLAQGLANGFISLGAGFGCFISKFLIKRFSRKNSILIVNLIAFVAGGMLYIPIDVIFFLMRIFQGICVGCYSSLIPNYIRQISPIRFQGTFGAFIQLFMSFGTFFCFLFVYILTESFQDQNKQFIWYFVFGFTQLIIFVQSLLILFIFPYQTPKYLILNGLKKQAIYLLKKLYLKEYVQKIYEQIQLDLQNNQNQEKNYYQNSEIQQNLINPKHRKTPKIAIFTAFFMSFSQQMYGMGAVIIYGVKTTSQYFPNIKNLIGIIINSPLVISAFVLSYLLSKYPRKYILQIGTILLALSNLIIALGFLTEQKEKIQVNFSSYLILIGEVLFNTIFAISAGSMLWIYMPAIVQPKILPFSTFFNWVSSAIVLIIFPILIDEVFDKNPGYIFVFFFIYTIFCVLIYSKFVIEIKDKTQTQIYNEYCQMKFCLFLKGK